MDFFVQQDKSRSKTGLLVFLFICAVLFVIAAVYAAIMAVMVYNSSSMEIKLFNPKLFFTISGVTLAIILVSSITKIIALSKGGSYVAESLGGRLVNSSTQNPDERKLLNVVEEMAIASGVPVPSVYVLNDEKSINAFAAGFSPNDAVVAVTLGCCSMLSRDELQGVVAHEFSHILNGDMRLNIRLIGFLSGIMVIATVGQIILRSGSTTRRRSYRSRSSGKGGGQILILALLFLAIGYIGVLLGRLIQSAVSRQREYLADASAVQFTRNPSGIASALKKIGGFSGGSKIISPSAGETCHMFFSSAISSLFSTHPPLPERIQRIEPGFKGGFDVVKAGVSPVETSSAAGLKSGFAQQAGADISVSADTVVSHVGNISPENIAHSAEILAAIPVKIKEELNDILGASAIVCALLLDKDPGEKKKQMELLERSAPLGLVRQITIVEKSLKGIDPRLRLPVLDLAIPTLRQMSFGQYENLKKYTDILVRADSKLTIFEFSFKEVLTHRLDTAFKNARQKISYKNITVIMSDVVCLLTALARVGHTDKKAAEDAFRAAISNLPAKREALEMDKKTSFSALHTALEHFAAASSGVKKAIFDACSQCVLFDKKVSINEAELLRAVAYSMDIPVPPFLSS